MYTKYELWPNSLIGVKVVNVTKSWLKKVTEISLSLSESNQAEFTLFHNFCKPWQLPNKFQMQRSFMMKEGEHACLM